MDEAAAGFGTFKDQGHALRAGMAFGAAVKAGLPVEPELDDQGNYTPVMLLSLEHLPDNVTIRIVVE